MKVNRWNVRLPKLLKIDLVLGEKSNDFGNK